MVPCDVVAGNGRVCPEDGGGESDRGARRTMDGERGGGDEDWGSWEGGREGGSEGVREGSEGGRESYRPVKMQVRNTHRCTTSKGMPL